MYDHVVDPEVRLIVGLTMLLVTLVVVAAVCYKKGKR